MNTEFEQNLQRGRLAENLIVLWLRSKGKGVITVYEIEHHTGKGPRYLTAVGGHVAPDILTFLGNGKVIWCETKRKTVFTWYRKGRVWTTGVDAHHFRDYCKVREESGLPVWLLFLHESSEPAACDSQHNCPSVCPTGLFGQNLDILRAGIDHESDRHGRHGMIYWRDDQLRLLAGMKEMNALRAKQKTTLGQ